MTTVRRQLGLAARDLAYLAIGLATSIVAFVVWVTALSITLSLAVFIIGIPLFIASAFAFRLCADLDRRNAAIVLGRRLPASYRDHHGPGILVRVRETAADPQTWRDLAWVVVHSVVGFGLGIAAVASVAAVGGVALLPAWFWSVPGGVDFGIWRIDSVGEAFAAALLAIPLAVLAVALLRAMALGEAALATALLAPPGTRPARLALDVDFARTAVAAAIVGAVCTLIWALTGMGYFWPAWVWLGLAIVVGAYGLAVRGRRAPDDPAWQLRVAAERAAGIVAACVVVWALAGGGYFWPVWPLLGMCVLVALDAARLYADRLPWLRERRLARRVDELTRTRRGALDVQASELRRIERDLHDGAQARLVSLSMLIGRAEEHLEDRPEAVELVRQAREEAKAAIGELRDLARGIAPPILADRGLTAAVEGLAVRAPMDVTVTAPPGDRPPPVVETAAYFVVSEALTNVAKHAPGASARVTLRREGDVLQVEIADNGPGGANPVGSGLTGLRRRVEALDGSLRVDSTLGQGTTVRAELPCG